MATKKNVIVGAASVFVGPGSAAGTGFPAVSGTTSYRTTVAAATNWRDVGYTQEGLEISTDPSYTDIEVDQLLDAVKIFKDGMGFSISTSFAEATLDNLLVAWGQGSSFLTNTTNEQAIEIEGGGLGDAPLERGLIAVGNGPERDDGRYSERTYSAYRVLSVESTAFTAARSDPTVFPVTFRALPADTGKYGTIRDRYNVA